METRKKIGFLALLLMLFLPMLQGLFHVVDEQPLDGAFVETPKPVVNLKTLFQETAQDSLMTYLTEQAGFRKTLIRLNNQLLYSAFGKVSAIGPVKGKNGQTFFEESYIISYTGETYIGEEQIAKNSHQIKVIQDMLRAKGITLLPVFALGKASYYPELIPDRYLNRRRETNNYQEYLKALQKEDVAMIDFNRYFCDRKDQFEHPVRPQCALDRLRGLAGNRQSCRLYGKRQPPNPSPRIHREFRHRRADQPGRRPLSDDEPSPTIASQHHRQPTFRLHRRL